LVIGVDAGDAGGKRDDGTRGGSAGRVRQRKQIPIGRGAKLIALKRHQRRGNWIDAGEVESRFQGGIAGGNTIGCGNIGNQRADDGSRRIAAALARARIVDEKEPEFPPVPIGPPTSPPNMFCWITGLGSPAPLRK